MKEGLSFVRKCIFLGTILIITILFISSCDISPDPTPIKNGFSSEMQDLLKDRYELTIPESAIFIDGYYDNEYQDNAVHITFKIPTDVENNIYSSNWEDYSGDNYNKDGIIRTMSFKSIRYTYLWYYESDGKYTKIKFQGTFPGKTVD
jgi:hypothetical protein